MTTLAHPIVIGDRYLWLDGDIITKLHHGDPTIGWEGDERLAVYFDQATERWEIWRLEDDNEYRRVCRSQPRAMFDERVLWDLCQWDRQRRTVSIHDEIAEHNDRLDRERRRAADDEMREEIIPRLRRAIERDR